jgi:hypothetical protein
MRLLPLLSSALAVTNLEITSFDDNSIAVSYAPQNASLSYTYSVGIQDMRVGDRQMSAADHPMTSVDNNGDTTYTFSGLMPGRLYKMQVVDNLNNTAVVRGRTTGRAAYVNSRTLYSTSIVNATTNETETNFGGTEMTGAVLFNAGCPEEFTMTFDCPLTSFNVDAPADQVIVSATDASNYDIIVTSKAANSGQMFTFSATFANHSATCFNGKLDDGAGNAGLDAGADFYGATAHSAITLADVVASNVNDNTDDMQANLNMTGLVLNAMDSFNTTATRGMQNETMALYKLDMNDAANFANAVCGATIAINFNTNCALGEVQGGLGSAAAVMSGSDITVESADTWSSVAWISVKVDSDTVINGGCDGSMMEPANMLSVTATYKSAN